MQRNEFEAARRALGEVGISGASLCAPFVMAFPISGAAVSILAGAASQSTVCASDAIAERLDELQFDLGEGPCWTALERRVPVISPDIRSSGADSWPTFTRALGSGTTSAVAAMYAFPLTVGALGIGAIDLYSTSSESLTDDMVDEASTLANLAASQVLRRILEDSGVGYDSSSNGFARREVHQATGMIIAQVGVGAQDAELLLRARAFASGSSVLETAAEIVAGRLSLSDNPTPNGGTI